MSLSDTANRALNAYGGEATWAQARQVRAVVWADGLVFRWKRWRPLGGVTVEAAVATPIVLFSNGNGELLATFDGDSAKVHEARFASDDEVRFCGMALWNYLAFPSLLARSDIRWTEPAEGLLDARFPASVPTHCERQRFHFDASGLLLRHDYTARFFGRWARAANCVTGHAMAGDVPYPSRRRVTPRILGKSLLGPALINLEVHQWKLE